MIAVARAYLHLVGVVALFATLFAEVLLFRPDLALAAQRRVVFVGLLRRP